MPRQRTQPLRDGLVAGLLGYIAVVLVFAAVNLLSGRSLMHTPEVLGHALLGTQDLGAPGAALAPVMAFNALHLLVSLLLGFAVSFLAERAETDHAFGLGLIFARLAVGGFVPIFFGAITVELLHALSWRDVLLGSGAGALATLGYIAWAHRALVRDLFGEARA